MDATSITAIIIAFIAAVPPSLIGLAALRKSAQANEKIAEVHIQVNDRMTQLLAQTALASRAEGVTAERDRPVDMIVIKDEGQGDVVERLDVERQQKPKEPDS